MMALSGTGFFTRRDPLPGEAPDILAEYASASSAGPTIAVQNYNAGMKPGDGGLMRSSGAGYSAGSVIPQKIT